MAVEIGHINIAETGTTTAVATDSDYPLYRLFDRFVNDLKWKSGSVGSQYLSGSELLTNDGFTSLTTGWTSENDASLSSDSGGQSGNCLSISSTYTTTGSDLISNGSFDSDTSSWSLGSSNSTATVVSGGQSGNAVNINNGVIGDNLFTNEGFETALGSEWKYLNGTIARAASPRTGTYACELTYGISSATTDLLTNDGFETGALTPWVLNGGSYAMNTTYPRTGTYCLRVTFTSTSEYVYQTISGLIIGRAYRIVCWHAPGNSSSYGKNVIISVRDTSGNLLFENKEPTSNTIGSYVRSRMIFVATTTSVRLCFGSDSTAGILLDDIDFYNYGMNLLSNNTFDSDLTDWTSSGTTADLVTSSVYGNMARLTGGSSSAPHSYGIQQTVTDLIIGHNYIVWYWATGSTFGVHVDTTSYTESVSSSANSYLSATSMTFTATSTTHTITLIGPSSGYAYYDEVYMFNSTFVTNETTYGQVRLYQKVSGLLPSRTYYFTCYFQNGSISSSGQSCYLRARRGSNFSAYDVSSYTIGSSYTQGILQFTMPSDETSMFFSFEKISSTGSVYVDDFSVKLMNNETSQYLQQEITGLTSGKRYKIDGYTLRPTTSDNSSYTIAAYRTDTGVLINSVSGSATTSWAAFSSLLVDIPSGQTSIYLRLIKNSSAYTNLRFDTITAYRTTYATYSSAYQDISTSIGYEYRLSVYVHNGVITGGLTSSPYSIGIYDSSTLIESSSGNTSSSWVQVSLDFIATSTTTRIKLIKNSSTDGNIAFDTASLMRLLYSYDDQWIKVDQDSSIEEINTLVIPSGHTLDGLNCQFQYSDDDSLWSDAVLDWTQSGSDIIVKQFTPSSHQYWRLYTTGSSSDIELPSLSEFYLTNTYTIVSNPKYNSIRETYVSSINKIEIPSWKYDSIINNIYRKKLEYELPFCSTTEKEKIEEIREFCLGKKPFFIIDHNSNEYFVELMEDIIIEPVTATHYNIKLILMETL